MWNKHLVLCLSLDGPFVLMKACLSDIACSPALDVFCLWKPHTFGKEYHSLCCTKSGVLTHIELIERKDHPEELPNPQFYNMGKTVGLLMQLLQPYFNSCWSVVLYSGFCVLKRTVELRKEGIFAGASIKKHQFWTTLVPGKAIDLHFEGKEIDLLFEGKAVGECNAILSKFDEGKYFIWGMKEPDYITKIIASGGPLVSDIT